MAGAVKVRIVVNDRMQHGSCFRCGAGRPKFAPSSRPTLTPKQMLHLGVFGGKYMTEAGQSFRQAGLPTRNSHPAGAGLAELLQGQGFAIAGGVAPQQLDSSAGSAAGSVVRMHYMGRRSKDDARQIRRWRATISRHVAAIRKELRGPAICSAAGGSGRPCSTGLMTAGGFDGWPRYRPPETSRIDPVVYEASSDSSHRMARATSSGVPPRFMGTAVLTRSTRPGSPPLP